MISIIVSVRTLMSVATRRSIKDWTNVKDLAANTCG